MLRSIATLTTGAVLTTGFGTDWPLRQAPRRKRGEIQKFGSTVGFELGCPHPIKVKRGDYFISQFKDS